MRPAALFVILFVISGCGSVSVDAGDAAVELGPDAGGKPDLDLGGRDAGVDVCPPVALLCSSEQGACPQGQSVGRRRDCGGAPYAVCCPVNDCELSLCDRCPLCP